MGLALSDPLGLTAQPLETFRPKIEGDLVSHILRLASEYQATRIIIGHPLNMDGTRGPKARESEAFAEALRNELDIPVELWDERLTSWQAEEYLKEAGLSRKKQREKGRIDQMAAQILLQSYLDAGK